VVTPAGNVVHVQVHARVHRDAAGNPQRILGVSWDVSDEVRQAAQRRELELQLRETSRQAGMAEIATGVLHNVGNVLNSLGVSASVLQSKLRSTRTGNVQRIAALLAEHRADLPAFLASERGREIPTYLAQLGENLENENTAMQSEVGAITANVGHIRNIVAAQQSYARRGGLTEPVDLAELLDSAIAIHFTEVAGVIVSRDYETLEPILVDRHKLLQIFGNLLSNARHALKARSDGERRLNLRLRRLDAARVSICVEDSGIGISADSLARLFEFGFTTKEDGHGFGLHTCAILAKELSGGLRAFSEGENRGARFELEFAAPAVEIRKLA
jgi:signal transduction histidine kinase